MSKNAINSWQTLSSAAGDPGALEAFSNLGPPRIKDAADLTHAFYVSKLLRYR